MATASLELGFRDGRLKKRRHSYSSARAFAAKPVVSPPAHSTSSLKRSGSLSGSHKSSSSDLTDNGGGARTGKRITKFLRSIKRKKSSLTSAHTAGASTSSEPEFQGAVDVLAEQKGEFVRVMVSVLHPQIIYKTLHITKHSTVFEVVVKLVSKYAFSQEDKDNPDAFYMTEVKESEQGSYSRLLENSDRVYDIQSRWKDGSKCSFTLCRKETLSVEDDPFLDSPLEAIVMSPSQDYFETGFTGVVDVDVPSVPVSPNSYSTKTSFFSGPMATRSEPLPYPPHESLLPMSPSELSSDEVSVVSKQRSQVSGDDSAQSPAVDVGRLMQESVSKGMLGIMTRVVTEGEQREDSPSSNRQRRATVGDVISPRRQHMALRQLVCSPVDSNQKGFPEFIFTPKISAKPSDTEGLEVTKLNFDETDTPEKPPATPLYRTTHTLSSVKFAVEDVFYPRYGCSASLYPSFSRSTLFSTAMDLTDAMYDMLESQLRPPSEENIFQISPPLSNKDTSEHRGLRLKRHHTFHVRRDHLQLHLQEDSERFPSFRDHLVERAAQAIRHRHSLSGSRLSGGDSLPWLHRVDSGTTVSRGSTVSISSEVETDLDALRDLRVGSYSSEHSLSALPLQVLHSRTDSDSVMDTRVHSIYRGSSSGSIQATGLDSTHFRPFSRKISDSHISRHTESMPTARLVADSRMYKSVEAIGTTVDSESHSSDEDEVLYTFQNNLRPVTVLVRSKSSHGLQEEEGEGPNGSTQFTKERRGSEGKKEVWNLGQRRHFRTSKSWLSEF